MAATRPTPPITSARAQYCLVQRPLIGPAGCPRGLLASLCATASAWGGRNKASLAAHHSRNPAPAGPRPRRCARYAASSRCSRERGLLPRAPSRPALTRRSLAPSAPSHVPLAPPPYAGDARPSGASHLDRGAASSQPWRCEGAVAGGESGGHPPHLPRAQTQEGRRRARCDDAHRPPRAKRRARGWAIEDTIASSTRRFG